MGTYFYYVNFTRRERFSISALGGGDKLSSIGRNLAARAFELMVTRRGTGLLGELPALCGRWAGDEVAVVGDDWDEDWDAIRESHVDIGANVILLLMEFDGFEPLREAAEQDSFLFMQLCHLATTGQSKPLEKEMEHHFGVDFRRRYKQMCQERVWFQPLNIVKGRDDGVRPGRE